MKKKAIAVLMAIVLTTACAVPALAETVYCNGSAVSWDHGRSNLFYSYSNVQTGVYTHSATANTTFSGWKQPGVLASASQLVGIYPATAYWNCK
jgi:hypothetical protein